MALALLLITPGAQAWAAGEVLIEREYEANGEEPTFDEFIVIDGVRYELGEITAPVRADESLPSGMRIVREMTINVEREPFESSEGARAFFPSGQAINEAGYVGSLGLVDVSVTESKKVTESLIERAVDFTGLPSNDVSVIPLTYDFEVASAEGPEMTVLVTFDRLSVEFELTSSGGREPVYTAHVLFRGLEHNVVTDYYTLHARYEGAVSLVNDTMVVTASYSEVPVADVVEAVPLVQAAPSLIIPEPAAPLAVQSTDLYTTIVAGLLVVLVLAFLLALLYLLSRNARLVDTDTNKVVARRRVKVISGQALFVIPEKIDLEAGQSFIILLKPQVAAQEGVLVVVWRGRSFNAGHLETRIDVPSLQTLLAMGATYLVEQAIGAVDGELVTAGEGS